ncbi:DUF6502 family protein [Oceanobacter mangrovi]|uniref:DUF6502 family protein n=1 Tax=Oceanobacter mangrovi TaxID=2862510 RepID=UPI001C8F06A3|nr:DUF6502 family protein [Oceanobacter mangrovi]
MSQLERPSRYLNAASRVLKPLVRLLLKNQVTYPLLQPLLKQLYVEVADQEFMLEDGKRQTESRLSLLTGIHRKEIKRLREDVIPAPQAPANLSLGGQLLAYWLSQPGYQADGQPQPIARQSRQPGDISFETLVETVGRQDIRPRAVLDEWQRLGIVTLNTEDQVMLTAEAYIPSGNEEEQLYYWQRNLADHIETASRNLDPQQTPLLERSVYYGQLSEHAVTELHDYYRQQSMELLKRVNDKARQLKLESPGNWRMNAGVYFSQQPLNQQPPLRPDSTTNSNTEISGKDANP